MKQDYELCCLHHGLPGLHGLHRLKDYTNEMKTIREISKSVQICDSDILEKLGV